MALVLSGLFHKYLELFQGYLLARFEALYADVR